MPVQIERTDAGDKVPVMEKTIYKDMLYFLDSSKGKHVVVTFIEIVL